MLYTFVSIPHKSNKIKYIFGFQPLKNNSRLSDSQICQIKARTACEMAIRTIKIQNLLG